MQITKDLADKYAPHIKLIPPEIEAQLSESDLDDINSIRFCLGMAQAEARDGYGEAVERNIGHAVGGVYRVLERNFLKDPADFLKNVIAEADKISGYVAIMPDYIAKREILKDFKRLRIMSEQVAQQRHVAPEPVGMH